MDSWDNVADHGRRIEALEEKIKTTIAELSAHLRAYVDIDECENHGPLDADEVCDQDCRRCNATRVLYPNAKELEVTG